MSLCAHYRWMDEEMWYIHNWVLFSHKEWNHVVCRTIEELEIIMLREISQTQKDKCHIFSYMQNLTIGRAISPHQIQAFCLFLVLSTSSAVSEGSIHSHWAPHIWARCEVEHHGGEHLKEEVEQWIFYFVSIIIRTPISKISWWCWFMPVILATQEAEIQRIIVWGQSRKNVAGIHLNKQYRHDGVHP
jgi:hypothetical protein